MADIHDHFDPASDRNEAGTHRFVSDDGTHCIHCGGYPFDLLHWCTG